MILGTRDTAVKKIDMFPGKISYFLHFGWGKADKTKFNHVWEC